MRPAAVSAINARGLAERATPATLASESSWAKGRRDVASHVPKGIELFLAPSHISPFPPTRRASVEWWRYHVTPYGTETIDANSWQPDADANKFVEELLKADLQNFPTEADIPANVKRLEPQTTIPDDVKALQLKLLRLTVPLVTQWKKEGCNVFLRPSMKDLFDQVYANTKLSETESAGQYQHSVIWGPSGCGKSRSTVYYLQLLLKAGELVIYQHCRASKVWAFVPSIHRPSDMEKSQLTYRAFVVNEFDWRHSKCAALQWATTHYIFDPPENTGEPPSVSAHTTNICSTNEDHCLTALGNDRLITTFYHAPDYSEPELMAVLEYAGVPLTQNLETAAKRKARVRERFYYFGGSLRRVCLPEGAANATIGLINSRCAAIPSQLLPVVMQALHADKGNVHLRNEDTFQPLQSTLIFKYMPKMKDSEGTDSIPPTYDFTVPVVKPLSKYVIYQILNHGLDVALFEANKLRALGDSTGAGRLFQNAALKLLSRGGDFQCKAYAAGQLSGINASSNMEWVATKSLSLPTLGMGPALAPWELTPLFELAKTTTFLRVPTNPQYPVADAYLAADVAFQATVSGNAKEFAVATLKSQVEGIAQLAKEAKLPMAPPLKIYIAVPADVFGSYCAKPTITKRKDKVPQDQMDFEQLLNTGQVQFFVLCINMPDKLDKKAGPEP